MEVLKQSSEALNKAVLILKNGGVVICPTDTVYGFLADAQNKKAAGKIFKIKKRPKSKPLAIFVRNLKMANEVTFINKNQAKILKKFWPGKYTFVFKRKKNVKLYGVDKKTIALRFPKYKFLNDLLKKIDSPLVQTSVNISNEPMMNKIKDIIEKFKNEKRVALIIDGGNLKKGKPSKIIKIDNKVLTRLR